MIISSFSKTGSWHRAGNRENQDYVYSVEGKGFIAVMLADGASACEKGMEGAKLACEAAAGIIEHEGSVFFGYSREKIAYLLTEEILYRLERNKAEDCDIREYGSTFALVYMEKKTGRTVLVNLGDGAVMSVTGDGFSYLLRPKRYRGNPCLTTTRGAGKAVEISVCNLALGDSVFVCSDGFLDQMSKEDVASLLESYDIEGLNRRLSSMENEDDCSFISFTRRRK